MENVLRVIRREDLDSSETRDGAVPRENLPNMDRIIKKLDNMLLGVESLTAPQEGVHLAVCFAIYSEKIRHMIIFPNNGTETRYELREEDFFVNKIRDPIAIFPRHQDYFPICSKGYFLFRKNPFENIDDYKHMEELLRLWRK